MGVLRAGCERDPEACICSQPTKVAEKVPMHEVKNTGGCLMATEENPHP
jgi:hypothetical protein